MKQKILCFFLAVAMVVLVVPAVSFAAENTSAPSINWTQMEVSSNDGVYALIGQVSSEHGIKKISTALNFDTNVIQPVNSLDFSENTILSDNSDAAPTCLEVNDIGYEYDHGWVEYGKSCKTYVDSENGRAAIEVTRETNKAYNEEAVFYYVVFHFKLAEGKSWDDVNSETFRFESLDPEDPVSLYVKNGAGSEWYYYADPEINTGDKVLFTKSDFSLEYTNCNNTVSHESFTITADPANGGTAYTYENAKNTKIVLPADPVKAPTANYTYNFIGWFNGETQVTADTVVTEDITITAKYAPVPKAPTEGDKTIEAAEINDDSITDLIVETIVGEDIVEIVFGSEAQASLKSKGDLTLSVVENTNTVEGAEKAFDIALKDDGGRSVGEFAGDVTVKLPFSFANGKTADDYAVFYIDGEGGKTDQKAVYDNEKGYYVFKASHFSEYAIMESESCYTFTAIPERAHYNAGDTVTVYIVASTDQMGKQFSAFHFTLADAPAGLTLTSLEPGAGLNGGTPAVNVANNSLAYVIYKGPDEGSQPVSVDENGIVIATAVYRVTNDAVDNSKAAIGFAAGEDAVQEMNVFGSNVSAKVTTEDSEITLHNIQITLNIDAQYGTIDGAQSKTYYGKYGQKGLYNAEGTAVTPDLSVKDGYVLLMPNWKNADSTKSDFNTLNDILNDEELVSGTYNLQAEKGAFDIAQAADNTDAAAVVFDSGVTNGKATYLTDVEFTVTPANGKLIGQVGYTVGGNSNPIIAEAVDEANGKYKIPGGNITGNIEITAETTNYVTITLTAATGAHISSGTTTAYSDGRTARLYSGKTNTGLTGDFVSPSVEPEAGYRLAAEPVWIDAESNTYKTSDLGNINSSVIFTADTTLTAQTVKISNVTFTAGEHGKIKNPDGEFVESFAVSVDAGQTITAPETQGDTGYEFDKWNPEISLEPITGEYDELSYTANFKDGEYEVYIPSNLSGMTISGAEKATHGTPYTLTVTPVEGERVTASISYTIGSNTTELFNGVLSSETGAESYTIPGKEIVGPISVNVVSNFTYVVTINVVNGDYGSVSPRSKTYSADGGTNPVISAADFTITTNSGYTYEWDTNPVGKEVTGDTTYTITFKDAAYMITDPDGTTASVSHGVDYNFTPDGGTGKAVTGVTAIINGDSVTFSEDNEAFKKNSDGTYTISGAAITGNITLSYATETGTWDYISFEQYKALEFGSGAKIAIFKTGDMLSDGGYTLSGSNMLYSEKYSGYVYIVDKDETDASLSSKLAKSNTSAGPVDYSGDTNRSGKVTGMDAIAFDDALNGRNPSGYIIDMRMRLSLDVTGDRAVTVSDVVWVLNKAVGN